MKLKSPGTKSSCVPLKNPERVRRGEKGSTEHERRDKSEEGWEETERGVANRAEGE